MLAGVHDSTAHAPQVTLRHVAPMPVGATVCVRVSVKSAVRRQLMFDVVVVDDSRAWTFRTLIGANTNPNARSADPSLEVARGTHSRVYINSDAFDEALRAKSGAPFRTGRALHLTLPRTL